MERRLELHEKLCDILGSRQCYFNPPESVKLKYPCIVYNRENGDSRYAGNYLYRYYKSYSITVIDRNPDSEYPDTIHASFPLCQFERWFVSDGLSHWVLRLFY